MSQTLMLYVVLAVGVSMMFSAARADEKTPKDASETSSNSKTMRVYVGTYTGPNSKGIYLYNLDLESGALKEMGLVAETKNPSFLAFSPGHKHLYAVGELDQFEGKKAGAVSAFGVDPGSGKLTLLNQQPSGGTGPCHVSVDSAGKFVFAANYGGGSIASFPVDGDGKLGEAASIIQHTGKGTDPARQKGPHAHGIWPHQGYVFACDLGLDKVLVYKLDAGTGKLAPHTPPAGDVPAGAGARHAAFGTAGNFLYVINEMGNTVTVFGWDGKAGTLSPVQTISTLPADYKEISHTAEIVVHPSGKFVYGSNRGHDSIATFSVDAAGGELIFVGTTPTGGNTPRNFNIDPTGHWLIAANQGSDTLVVFRINPKTGALAQVGETTPVGSPACVVFAPAE